MISPYRRADSQEVRMLLFARFLGDGVWKGYRGTVNQFFGLAEEAGEKVTVITAGPSVTSEFEDAPKSWEAAGALYRARFPDSVWLKYIPLAEEHYAAVQARAEYPVRVVEE